MIGKPGLSMVSPASVSPVNGEPLSEETLKEVIGHTPRQVYAGALFGLIVGLLVEEIWMLH